LQSNDDFTPSKARCALLPAERADPVSVAAAANDRETGRRLNCAAISIISCRIAALFALPSSPQPAYPEAPDMPVCGGRAFAFFVPRRRRRMAKGTVKWFNPTKGYGFIQPATGGKDVFVHISAVQKAGLSTLNEGQTIEYEEIANRGKTSAENLKV
jgi:CspA family cold shock protein